jgi:hypothetical protein
MRTFLRLPLLLAVLTMVSCAPTETVPFQTELDFTFDGPLFEGPESGQASLKASFDAFLIAQGLERHSIKEVKLTEAVVFTNPEYPSQLIADAGLTFAGGDLEMVQVGVINPFPEGGHNGSLNVSDEAKITPFFRASDFIILLDLGFSDDLDDDYTCSAKLNFDVTYKTN